MEVVHPFKVDGSVIAVVLPDFLDIDVEGHWVFGLLDKGTIVRVLASLVACPDQTGFRP